MDTDAPKKTAKLPFKPTALRKQASRKSQDSKDGAKIDSLDFFKRSEELKPLLTAEAKKRARREAEREARNRKSTSVEKHDKPDNASDHELSNSQKKRRVDEEQDDDMYDCTPPPSTPAMSQSSPHKDAASSTPFETPSKNMRSSVTSSAQTTRYRDESLSPRVVSDVQVIDADTIVSGAPSLAHGKSAEVVDSNDDDNDSIRLDDDDLEVDAATQALMDKYRAEQNAAEEETRDVRIKVATRIPGVAEAIYQGTSKKEFKCQVKYQGELKIVKETWCRAARNGGFDIRETDIFLTWRGLPLYNSTTMKSLGIKFIGSSRFYAGDGSQVADLSGFTEDRKFVLVEAWTKQVHTDYLEELEQERRRELGEVIEDKEHSPSPVQEAKIRITIRPKQGEPVKISVAASGIVGDLAAKFRAKRQIPSDVKVTIVFDGEKLQDHLSLEDADITDDDLQVDVLLG